MTLDDSYVYWTDSKADNVMRITKAGGAPGVIASDQKGAADLRVDASAVYWTVNYPSSSLGPGNKAVVKAPIAGGNAVVLANVKDSSEPVSIGIDEQNVFWTDFDHPGDISVVAKSGGKPKQLATSQMYPRDLAVFSGTVYWTNFGNEPTKNDGSIMSASATNGRPKLLAKDQSGPWSLAVDETGVYWLCKNNDGSVMKLALGGGAPIMLASHQGFSSDIALDHSFVYWTNGENVMKISKDGGEPATLASGQNKATGIAVDATSIYWTTRGDGKIMKLAKSN